MNTLPGSVGFTVTGASNDRMGRGVVGGDIKGDGADDIIVGAPGGTP